MDLWHTRWHRYRWGYNMNTKIDKPTGLTVIFREKTNKSYEKSVRVIKDEVTYIAF